MMVQGINYADAIIACVILVSIIISLARGFVREALSLVTWVAAFWVALTFTNDLAIRLKPHIATPSLQTASAFVILFLGVLILGGLINRLINVFVEKTGLTGTDRLLGIIFGFTRGVLLVAMLLLLAKLTPLQQNQWWQTSQLIPRFEPFEVWLHSLLPEDVGNRLVTSSQ